MENIDIVINGIYKGYKIIFDKTDNSIQLKSKKETIILNGRIKSVSITNKTLGDENIHYFEMKETNEKIYCLLDFNTYLLLIILGMQVPAECVCG